MVNHKEQSENFSSPNLEHRWVSLDEKRQRQMFMFLISMAILPLVGFGISQLVMGNSVPSGTRGIKCR